MFFFLLVFFTLGSVANGFITWSPLCKKKKTRKKKRTERLTRPGDLATGPRVQDGWRWTMVKRTMRWRMERFSFRSSTVVADTPWWILTVADDEWPTNGRSRTRVVSQDRTLDFFDQDWRQKKRVLTFVYLNSRVKRFQVMIITFSLLKAKPFQVGLTERSKIKVIIICLKSPPKVLFNERPF